MSLRDRMNKNAAVGVVGAALIIVVAGVIFWRAMPDSGSGGGGGGTAYYTTDDGATFVAGDPKGISPITIDGKQAYQATVYQCEGGKPFVVSMMRYKPEYKAVLEQARTDPNSVPMEKRGLYMSASISGIETKKPGEKQWKTPSGAPAAPVLCPDGKPAMPKQ